MKRLSDPPVPPPRRRRPARGRGLVLALALLGTSGCFEYREDIWLYADHSGRVEGQVRVPADAWAEYGRTWSRTPDGLKSRFAQIAQDVEGVDLTAFNEFTTSGNHRISWTYAFDGPQALAALFGAGDRLAWTLLPVPTPEPLAAGRAASVTRLARMTTVRRVVPAIPDVLDDPRLEPILASRYARFRVHAPERIIGPAGLVLENDEHTATWEPAMHSLAREGLDIRVSYRQSWPIARLSGMIGGLLAGLAGIWGFAYLHMMRGVPAPEPEPASQPAAAPAPGDSGDSFEDDWEED